jgi:thioester reductase-like protein
VFRVGTIGPHSETGRFQRNIDAHFFSRYLNATMQLGIAVDWANRGFAIIPVDILARVIVLIAGRKASADYTFHLQTPHTVSHGEMVHWLNLLGYQVDLLEPDDFLKRIAEHSASRLHAEAVGRLLPLADRPVGVAPKLDASWTIQCLRQLDFEYPQPLAPWFSKFIHHGIDRGYFPQPQHAVVRERARN